MPKPQDHIYEITLRPAKTGEPSPTILQTGKGMVVNHRGDLLIIGQGTMDYQARLNACYASGSWLRAKEVEKEDA